MGKNSNNSSLGRSLVKSRFTRSALKTGESEKWLHTMDLEDTSDWSKTKTEKSVTEQSALDEFLTTAEMAGKEFESEKLNLKIVNTKSSGVGVLNTDEMKRIRDVQSKNMDLLRIPRRPVWKGASLDGKELQAKEREAFLDWRRDLSRAQENEALSMTPYEKNLEFWRQLWRVIERSDVVVQIVDARNPLLFYCKDLEIYVKEVDANKVNLVLVNKSDFLTAHQRLEWLRYFVKHSIRVAFWSAAMSHQQNDLANLREQEEHEEEESSSDQDEENFEDDEDDDQKDELASDVANKFRLLSDEKNESDQESSSKEDSESDEYENEQEEESQSIKNNPQTETNTNKCIPMNTKPNEEVNLNNFKNSTIEEDLSSLEMSDDERSQIRILTREELIELFKSIHAHVVDKSKPGCTTIGLVGYPNVGKSSTINALMGNKRVAVSDTPGKTKHYQTMFVGDDGSLLLCDCPGLVFPSFVCTRGELILNGVLSIDQMRDYVEPMNLLIQHVPRRVFEMLYGIELPKPKEGQDPERLPLAEELCSTYSRYRGYMNHKGTPDVQRGARYLLKDYMNGKLLYCYPPPGVDAQSFQEHRYEASREIKYMEKMAKMQQKMLNVNLEELCNPFQSYSFVDLLFKKSKIL